MSNAEPKQGTRTEQSRSRSWMRYTEPTECGVEGCDESFHLSLAREYHYLRNHADR